MQPTYAAHTADKLQGTGSSDPVSQRRERKKQEQ